MEHDGYVFPFFTPDDLATATSEELHAVLASVKDHAQTLSTSAPSADTVAVLTACRDLALSIRETLTNREAITALSSELGALDDVPSPEPKPEAEPEAEPEPTTAASRTIGKAPSVRDITRRPGTPDLPPDQASPYLSIHAAVDIPGRYGTGAVIDTIGDAVAAVASQLDRYPAGMTTVPGKRTRGVVETEATNSRGTCRREMRSFTRHGAIELRRSYPEHLRADISTSDGFAVARRAADERRLPGGSLLESFRRNVKAGRTVTAAAGWCPPSEVLYDLCELDSLDGILSLPEIQASRGGFQIPANGGPDFGTVYGSIGDAGDTHLTEAEVIAETAKVCWDIPCDSFTDNRLGVDYVCLTGSLLQRRGYPEAVEWYVKRTLNALPHKINQGVIAAIAAASGGPYVIPPDPSGDDAISSLLSAVGLAIMDAKYRNRMLYGATMEVILPYWVLEQVRAAGTRRSGVDLIGITEEQLMDWFAIRNAIPNFVYDWQDAFSGNPIAPGAGTPITSLPLTAQFIVYPAGTWVKAVQPVISLDTVYDSTKLTTNEYTALFAEDGWAALQMCPLSRLYLTQVDPSGVTGCCPIS